MDIAIARTFLEVVKTGSFVSAAENLNVSQTAVSARIRVLEEQLERPVFVRNKAGARLTPAGEEFVRPIQVLGQERAAPFLRLGDQRVRLIQARPERRDFRVVLGGCQRAGIQFLL